MITCAGKKADPGHLCRSVVSLPAVSCLPQLRYLAYGRVLEDTIGSLKLPMAAVLCAAVRAVRRMWGSAQTPGRRGPEPQCELDEERLDPARARGIRFCRALASPTFNRSASLSGRW